jgi:putative redox protein
MQDESKQDDEARALDDSVSGEGRLENGFVVSMMAAGQTLVADEPLEQGGSGHGPSPYDYLSLALVSCTIMTLNMYARRKEWPLESVRAEVRHGKIHAKDCQKCKDKDDSRKVDRFDRVLYLEGDLDDDQRQRLLEIANRCPVHRTLHEEVEVRTRLAD